MPIRIYALAKELKIDNKILVDICTKAGITGKGSALASLSDEEMEKLKAFMGAGKGGKGAAAAHAARGDGAAAGVLRREDYIAPMGSRGGKIPVLAPKLDKPPLLKQRTPEKTETSAEPPPLPAAPTGEPLPSAESIREGSRIESVAPLELPPAAPEPMKSGESPLPAPPDQKRPESPRPTESPVRPSRPPALGKLREERREEKKPRDRERRDRDRGPAIKLAPLPPPSKSPAKAKPKEPAPQKPDIRLPKDAIRAGKAGAKPLSEHLRKAEEKRKASTGRGPKSGIPRELPLPSSELPAGKERKKIAKDEIPEKGEDGLVAMGGREQRQLKRKKTASVKRRHGGEEEETASAASVIARRKTRIRRTGANTAAPRKESVIVQLPCTVRTFSEALGVPARTILAKLLEMGTMTNIAANLDAELAELLASELGVDAKFHHQADIEEQLLPELDAPDDPATLEPRPPIVTFLGHVDHGKTSLLDRILGIDVASKEKGGITQHIRAYRVAKAGRSIAFVDTPGHEAFTEMRARGANVTDIAVLVVAAEDGVMPQTEEAISHARAAGVPIVVALNKMDLPGANAQRVYEQLAANELLPSEWGGETEVVKCSAITGLGMEELVDTLLTVAELHEYKANPHRPARGTCLEAEINEDRGVSTKLLVRDGTLRVGDIVVCGATYGRVKAMNDTLAPFARRQDADPSTPVNVTGLNAAPGAGDRFYVLDDIGEARELAEKRFAESRRRALSGTREHITLENLYERLGRENEVQTLNIILRADVRGSIEAIRKELTKLDNPEVQIKILQATVGGITEADVHLAHASDAIIIGFSVVPDEKARSLAEQLGVQVRRYDIIYQVTDDLKLALEGMLRPERLERDMGRALVLRTFHVSKTGTVAGCRVLSGTILRDARIRVIRENRIIGDYPLESLKREKDDAREVREGFECGMKIANFNDVKEGDILEAYKIEEVARTL
ncbi:MAG: translation initiation factor IF-2 [Pirellulales bacterium]|nr:translation initiation factor IF-2 [Pirellulales bacterium]